MQTAGAGPSANSAQKFTVCENDRFEWLRPSGRLIFAADVTIASDNSTLNRTGCSRFKCSNATARQPTPAATTAATYARAFGGSEKNVGIADAAILIAPLP